MENKTHYMFYSDSDGKSLVHESEIPLTVLSKPEVGSEIEYGGQMYKVTKTPTVEIIKDSESGEEYTVIHAKVINSLSHRTAGKVAQRVLQDRMDKGLL